MVFDDKQLKEQIKANEIRISSLLDNIASLTVEVTHLKDDLNKFKEDFNAVITDTKELNKMERENAESLQKMMNYDPFNFNGVNSNE